MRQTITALISATASLTGRRWHWRAGNMDLSSSDSHVPQPDFGLSDDLVTQLLLARGVPRDDLDRHRQPTLRAFLPDPSRFRDMDTAAARLADAIIARQAITVYGDYDVDGATSAALLIKFVRSLGHNADPYIPDRLLEGYGPSGEALVRLAQAGAQLIVTVDCGAMAHEALEMAASVPVDVIVVDHHKCSTELPRALAMVNPNRLDEHPEAAANGHMAAVGVAFLLAVATLRVLRGHGYFAQRREPDLLGLLDLVALGTVADVAALKGVNRALVAQGLKVMAKRDNVGMAALIDACNLGRAPTCSDLGFALGPRVNAGGRVGEATLGVRLLTSEDPQEAQAIAKQLCRHNDERRAIEAAVQQAAEDQMAAQANQPVLVLAGVGWHPGVIGIVAGRIKEKAGKPTFIIAMETDETSGAVKWGKGSGRSIAGVDIGAAVIAARASGLLIAGGGHAMAAGLTVPPDGVAALTAFFIDRLEADVAAAQTQQSLALDLAVAPGGLTPHLVETLESAGPYGMGWPGPRVAVGPVRIVKADLVGADHVRLIVRGDDGGSFKCMAFRAAQTPLGQTLLHGDKSRKLWLAGRARIDDWGARPAAELHLDDAGYAD